MMVIFLQIKKSMHPNNLHNEEPTGNVENTEI